MPVAENVMMPYLRCPKCRTEQLVPTTMLGLEVDCTSCPAAFVARERGPRQPKLPAEPTRLDSRAFAKTLVLLATLLAFVGGAWWLAVSLINRANHPAEDFKPLVAEKVPPRAPRELPRAVDGEKAEGKAVPAAAVDDAGGLASDGLAAVRRVFGFAVRLLVALGLLAVLAGVSYYAYRRIRESQQPLVTAGLILVAISAVIYCYFLLLFDVTISDDLWPTSQRYYNLPRASIQDRWCNAAGVMGVMGVILIGFGTLQKRN
jgi:lysylphosphatidylglycerol synthetase-like protein (DUF2156 family)